MSAGCGGGDSGGDDATPKDATSTTAASTGGDEAGSTEAPKRPDGPAGTFGDELTGGNGLSLLAAGELPDLAEAGYTEGEYPVSGTATGYKSDGELPADGTFKLIEQGSGEYNTRVVVRRPKDPANFNGTVVVEWNNVSSGADVAPDYTYMADEIVDYFSCPRDKIDVIPNGVDTERFDRLDGLQDLALFRNMYALPFEQIVFSVGRIVYEKGLHLLIDAMPAILAQHPTAKIVIAGKGPELDALRSQAWRVGVGEKVLLTGFITDEDRDKLFKIASCAVFPSIYEPFGIVALEAMAARCPVVVTEVGGLKDVVLHNETGIVVYPNNPDSLAWGIVHTLKHPEWSRKRVANAYEVVRTRYNWEHIARDTAGVYRQVVAERAVSNW